MDQTAPPNRPTSAELHKLKTFLVNTLTNEFGSAASSERLSSTEVKGKLADIYNKLNLQLPEAVGQKVQQEAYDEILGYGPIQPLLEDPLINEIMINGPGTIFIERGGKLIETGVAFQDEAHLMRVINRIIQPLGRRVDEEHPSVDARLPDGSRVNAVVPPVAVDGPYLTIRKFLRNKMTLEDLLAMGSLTQHMAEFLQACVAARLNILITGGTSSGKTTMLNIL
jgi:pilus assembly protein CpaF